MSCFSIEASSPSFPTWSSVGASSTGKSVQGSGYLEEQVAGIVVSLLFARLAEIKVGAGSAFVANSPDFTVAPIANNPRMKR
jgi:hypothetical protein